MHYRARREASLRYDTTKFHNSTSIMLNKVCPDVRREPRLVEKDGEYLTHRTANRSQEARLDTSATGFWTPRQRAFFYTRVFDLNARRYRGLELEK